jgi:hypothetical protein
MWTRPSGVLQKSTFYAITTTTTTTTTTTATTTKRSGEGVASAGVGVGGRYVRIEASGEEAPRGEEGAHGLLGAVVVALGDEVEVRVSRQLQQHRHRRLDQPRPSVVTTSATIVVELEHHSSRSARHSAALHAAHQAASGCRHLNGVAATNRCHIRRYGALGR